MRSSEQGDGRSEQGAGQADERGKALLVEAGRGGGGDREDGHIFHDTLSDIMNERRSAGFLRVRHDRS